MTRSNKPLAFLSFVLLCFLALPQAVAEACYTAADMDAATKSALEQSARQYFELAARGDLYTLRHSAIPLLASNFGPVESVVVEQKPNFATAQAAIRTMYVLEASGSANIPRAEFYCGIYNSPERVGFVIPDLPPGHYAVVIQDVSTAKGPYTLSLILKREPATGRWLLAGYYSKPGQITGHDATWFLSKAREYKSKGQNHNAWLYYLTTWDLMAPLDFMSTPRLDKLVDEMQLIRPSDLPLNGPADLTAAGGKTYKLTHVSAVPVEGDLNLLVKYQSADVSNTQRAFDDNMAVIKALVNKTPEYREAFAGVVARAVEPSGRDYGSLLAMKDVK